MIPTKDYFILAVGLNFYTAYLLDYSFFLKSLMASDLNICFQMKEEKMLARIREAEKSQSLAELTQKISSLEFKVMNFFFLHLNFLVISAG